MRAVFDHSLQLLREEEREVFRRLTVFCGGFTREAAEAIAGASFQTLATLVDKSLLHLNADGRYTIHELLRQYAQDDDPALRERHAAFFMGMLRAAPLKSPDQMAALDAIEADVENIRIAWEWAVESQSGEMIREAMENLSLYCDMRTQYQLAIKLLRLAYDRLDVPPLLKSQIKAQIIRMIMFGGIEHQLDLQGEIDGCLAVAQEHGSPHDEAFCLYLLGMAAMANLKRQPQYLYVQIAQEAVVPMREALSRFRELGDLFYVADALTWLGSGELSLGHIEEGLSYQQQGLETRRELGDRHGATWVVLSLGHTFYNQRQFQEAESYLRQAADIMREYRSIKGIVSSVITLSLITLNRGDFEETRRSAQEVLALSRSVNYLEGELSGSGMLSILACLEEEDYEAGMALAQQTRAIGERDFVAYIDPLFYAGLSFAACGLGDFRTMRQNHKKLYWKPYDDPVAGAVVLALEAVARCREENLAGAVELLALARQIPDRYRGWMDRWAALDRVRTSSEERLGRHAFAEAWERGSNLEVDEVIPELAELGPSDAQSQANQALLDPLTERELEIIGLVAAGMSNREIAEHLVLSVGTVKVHTRHIYQKLGVSSRTQAAARAGEVGLL
jgi:DNA-binding CsgD family transcriptional regulator